MRGTTRTVAVAALSAVALLAAGCGSGDAATPRPRQLAARRAARSPFVGATRRTRSSRATPTRPVVATSSTPSSPSSSTTTPRRPSPSNDIAQSIETTDNQNFTVKLKPGYKFHDGTDVTAKSFVDAWNYAAYGPNAQSNGYFMEPIEGFADLQCAGTANPDDPCEGYTPKAKEMSGLKVVDDNTFTIKTTEKVSNLPVRLGYSAFAPLPEVFFKDPKAFGDKPIGSGPYKLDSWTKEQAIVLSKFADYSGDFGGKVDKVTFKIYQDPDAAYNDVHRQQPRRHRRDPDQRPDRRQVQVGPARPQRARRSPDVIQTITAAPAKVDPNYADPKIRRPISMAIDRDTITKQIFNGTREPGRPAGSPRSSTATRPAAAVSSASSTRPRPRRCSTEAGGFKGDKMTIAYNADGDHKDWVEATCNSIKQTLGVDCQAAGVVDFATFRTQINARR